MAEPQSSASSGEVRICILAGGRSLRMGRDKAAVSLAGATLLDRVARTAAATGWPVGLIREDAVASCGPLSGILTGFEHYPQRKLLFLPCDMPFVGRDLLAQIGAKADATGKSVFVEAGNLVGFPFLIARGDCGEVRRRFAAGEYSLQRLAQALGAARIESQNPDLELFNINTPADLERAEELLTGSARDLPSN